jgi:hypothetical protein
VNATHQKNRAEFQAPIQVLLGWDVPTCPLILGINTSFFRRINAPWPYKAELKDKYSGTQKEAKWKNNYAFTKSVMRFNQKNTLKLLQSQNRSSIATPHDLVITCIQVLEIFNITLMEKEQKHNHSNKRPRTSSSKNKEITEKGLLTLRIAISPLRKKKTFPRKENNPKHVRSGQSLIKI